ncbi:ABC transporter permease [uncultured Cellulomonas sp.]|uniref:ABC transporter permease n=1 Tax=uncultured Cellulomonas sp. TaxID=189682 RepID=UPI0028E49628|nr:ABC transporter permease [uncultured Cellulomonas sp.]
MTAILENTADVPPNPTTPENPEDVKGLSQGRIVLRRFFGHTGAVVSMAVLFGVLLLAVSAIGLGPIPGWWKYSYLQTPQLMDGGRPTLQLLPFSLGDHPFGQDRVGRDMFAMTMRGTQISMFIMLMVGAIAAMVGVLVGSSAGFFRGKVEAVLMRFTDMIIIIPALIAAAVVANSAKSIWALGLFLGLVSWTGMARLVRGDFLTLREREFVDAARLAGASSRRIIFKHILPNAVGVITVNTTLLMSAAILTETALSYVQLGVRSPDVSLGLLISANQAAFATRPWLFWWPGIFIVIICLTINFIGDGLRDAFDPRQKKFALRRVKETRERPDLYAQPTARGPVAAGGATTVASGGIVQPLDQPRDMGETNDDGEGRR